MSVAVGALTACSGGVEQANQNATTAVRACTGPKVTVVRWIADFDTSSLDALGLGVNSNAVNRMLQYNNYAQGAYPLGMSTWIDLLKGSRNDPSTWGNWWSQGEAAFGKEHRGWASLSNVTLYCNNGSPVSVQWSPSADPGYTPTPDIVPRVYSAAEAGPSSAYATFTDYYAELHYRTRGRIATAERQLAYYGNALLLGMGLDAPFIWDDLTYRITCGGDVTVTANLSVFPQSYMYIASSQAIYSQNQDPSKLGNFMFSGGTTYNPPGVGNDAPGTGVLTRYAVASCSDQTVSD